MKKIIIPILVMLFVFSLAWIAGAQTSSSSQSGSSQQYGGNPPEGRQPYGTEQSGTSQQYRGKESQEPTQRHKTGERYGSSQRQERSMEDYKASNWIGMKVQNQQGDKLGEIEDLVLNARGQIDFVIVSHGGILGIGDKYTAVPFSAFSRKDDKTMILDISKEKMAEAPNFDKNKWPDMSNRKWSEDVYRYYGKEPYWSEPSQQPSQKSSRTQPEKEKMK